MLLTARIHVIHEQFLLDKMNQYRCAGVFSWTDLPAPDQFFSLLQRLLYWWARILSPRPMRCPLFRNHGMTPTRPREQMRELRGVTWGCDRCCLTVTVTQDVRWSGVHPIVGLLVQLLQKNSVNYKTIFFCRTLSCDFSIVYTIVQILSHSSGLCATPTLDVPWNVCYGYCALCDSDFFYRLWRTPKLFSQNTAGIV